MSSRENPRETMLLSKEDRPWIEGSWAVLPLEVTSVLQWEVILGLSGSGSMLPKQLNNEDFAFPAHGHVENLPDSISGS